MWMQVITSLSHSRFILVVVFVSFFLSLSSSIDFKFSIWVNVCVCVSIIRFYFMHLNISSRLHLATSSIYPTVIALSDSFWILPVNRTPNLPRICRIAILIIFFGVLFLFAALTFFFLYICVCVCWMCANIPIQYELLQFHGSPIISNRVQNTER